MTLDENAAAYGLFHLTFANLTQQLATAVFLLRRVDEPKLSFGEVFKLDFSRLVAALQKQLDKLKKHSSMAMEIQLLRRALREVRPLAEWRNKRAHPRVRIDENGIAIFDWRTGKPLKISSAECDKQIQTAVRLTVDIDMYAASLARHLQSQAKINALIEEIFTTLYRS